VASVKYDILRLFPKQTVGLEAGLVTVHCPKTIVEPKRKANKKTKKFERIT
jgi:hypothetical protein